MVVVVQSVSPIWLFVTPWTAALQASLSFIIFQSLLKLMLFESVMPSNHLVLCPSPPALSLSQHQGLFQWAGSSHQMIKVLELQLQHQSFQWIFRVDFLRIDWLISLQYFTYFIFNFPEFLIVLYLFLFIASWFWFISDVTQWQLFWISLLLIVWFPHSSYSWQMSVSFLSVVFFKSLLILGHLYLRVRHDGSDVLGVCVSGGFAWWPAM